MNFFKDKKEGKIPKKTCDNVLHEVCLTNVQHPAIPNWNFFVYTFKQVTILIILQIDLKIGWSAHH